MPQCTLSVKNSAGLVRGQAQCLTTSISSSEMADDSSKCSLGATCLFQSLKDFREKGAREKSEWEAHHVPLWLTR